MLVESEGRLAPDYATVALEQLQAHSPGDALLHVFHERIERGARRREPQAVVDEVGIMQADQSRQTIEIPGRHELLELFMSRVQHDRGGRLVDLA